MSPVAPQPLRLFISYSHKDAKLKDELLEHLEVVRRVEGVDVWTDDRIDPGADWREEIEKGLQQADIALLLVSPAFLASDFIQDNEMPDVLARQAAQGLRVIPVIMRDCAWKQDPVISRMEEDVLPWDGEPVTRYKDSRRDRAFTEVATKIARLARKRSGRGPAERPPPPPVPPPTPSQSGMLDRDGPPSSRMDWTGQINVWEMLGVITNMAVDRREDDLVGRAPLLEEVREALHAKGGRGVVLFGMTGIGKTWIAQAVASSARREIGEHGYPGGVFWVSGSSHEEFLAGLASIGVAFGKNEEAPEEVKIETARRALRDPKEPALLVVDHIDAPAPWVQQELEAVARGTRLLATTTHAPTGFLHGPGRAHWIRVDALERDDAYAWVQSLAPRLRPSEIDMLLTFFERHTLALDVAARTLHDDPMLPVSRYLDSLRAGRDYTDEPEVTGAGLTALQALRFLSEHTTAPARKAWSVAGCFASAPIPVGWLRAALAVNGMSDSEARAGVKELVRRHLGVRVGEGAGMTLPLHPLVHIVARTLATDLERSAMAQGIVQWIPGFEDPELHLKVPPAWPHIEAAWGASAADPLVALRLAALLKHRGHRADLNRAREMLEATISVAEQIEGPNSEAVAAVCNALGCILMDLGTKKYLEDAERMLRRALTIDESPLGRDAPTVAVRLSNLAMVLKNLGGIARFEEAEILLRRALDIDEQALGENAQPVAVRLSNLAMVLRNLGGQERLEEAEGLLRRAVKIQQKTLGPDSPTVAMTLSNLAMVLTDLGEPGQLEEAEIMLRRALDIRENALGLDAPRVAVTLHNLAMVLQGLGEQEQLEEAEALLRRALTIEENALGVDAPKVSVTLCNLASVLKTLGGRERLAESISLLERASEISMQHLGPMHIQTKTIRTSIERVRRALKKLDDQEPQDPPSRRIP
jgi:tetratricopeptide (TPR) repeat protein